MLAGVVAQPVVLVAAFGAVRGFHHVRLLGDIGRRWQVDGVGGVGHQQGCKEKKIGFHGWGPGRRDTTVLRSFRVVFPAMGKSQNDWMPAATGMTQLARCPRIARARHGVTGSAGSTETYTPAPTCAPPARCSPRRRG